MPLGPVEILVVQFPGSQVKGDVVPAMKELVESGTVRIIDILFVKKDQNGSITMTEINDLDRDSFIAFDNLVADVMDLLSESDVQQLSKMLANNSSAWLMLFENTWATRFRDAVVHAQGQVLLNERIPRTVIEQVMAAGVQSQA